MTRWAKSRPVATFVLLAFGISYLVGGPVLILGTSMIPSSAPLLHTYAPRVFVVFGPGLAALVLTSVSGREGGAWGLVRRLVPSGPDLIWAAGILVGGAASSAAALSVAGVGPHEVGRIAAAHAGLLLGHAALQVSVVATGEELGWRGWLLPRLAERMSRLQAALLTGAVWGIWHGPLLLAGARQAAMFLLMVLGLSVLFTWLWARGRGRLFSVVVAHAAVNTPLFFWEQSSTLQGHGGESLRMAWYALEAIYATAGLLLVVARWHWWRVRDSAGTW